MIIAIVTMYNPAIRAALSKGAELKELKALSRQATAILKKQGDLPGALKDLNKAIAKLEAGGKRKGKK